MARLARAAARILDGLPATKKNAALCDMASALESAMPDLLAANARDVAAARVAGLSPAMIDRLTMTEKTVRDMGDGLREVASLPDPVGRISSMWRRPNGLLVGRMRIPLGVVCIVYESRPNVTVDAAALCLKSGNAVLLRGGSEAIRSNRALGTVLQGVLARHDIPPAAIQVLPTTDRRAVRELLRLDEWIDLVIPRGGEELIRAVVRQSRIPVIKHYKGVCHIFVDDGADIDQAVAICMNAKTQRPGVCNAMETLLVHEGTAGGFLPRIADALRSAGVMLRGCTRTREILPELQPATEEDWHAEYLDLILAIRVVSGIDEAMEHIARYGSLHTESILTRNYGNAQRFLREVGSSTVLVNASTRFSDGHQLGLGAEIGISTTKLHAFGPMGLEELTTAKFIVYGDGQIRT